MEPEHAEPMRPHVLREYALLADGPKLFASAGRYGPVDGDTWRAATVAADAIRQRFTEEYDVTRRQLRGKSAAGLRPTAC
ncbi:MAG TPA: hypothetical protein VGM75_15990 [Pseudonocardiaceae bacterium]